VTTDDSGTYTCVAKNRQKSVEADITLIVDGKMCNSVHLDHDIVLFLLYRAYNSIIQSYSAR
jgi:hypothetical protein